jgi:glucan biosynthesis protein C
MPLLSAGLGETNPPPGIPRYHALDALRGVMMLGGVVIHAFCAYSTLPDVWWLKDRDQSTVLDALILFLHIFRLPVFFVMSGFFAAMLMEKRGWQGFLENRTARLMLPMLLGMVVISPLLRAARAFAVLVERQEDLGPGMAAWFARELSNRQLDQAHFWFLETLFWLCVLAVPLSRILNRLRSGWFRAVMTAPFASVCFAIPSFAALSTMEFGLLATPRDLMPNFKVLAAYGVYFAVGWGLWLNRELLPRLERNPWPSMALAVLLAPVNLFAVLAQASHREAANLPMLFLAAGTGAWISWLMCFSCLSLFLRHTSGGSPRWRYLSDSAYWIYLVHPLVLVMIQIPLLYVRMAGEWKALLGLVAATPVLLWSYDRFARNSGIGALLNGRRYPRGLPPADVPSARPASQGRPG